MFLREIFLQFHSYWQTFFFLSSLFLSSVSLIPLSHTYEGTHAYAHMQTRGLCNNISPCCHNLQCFKSKIPFSFCFLLNLTGYWPKVTVTKAPAYCSWLTTVYQKLIIEIQYEHLVGESSEGFYEQKEMKQLCGSLPSPIKVRWESTIISSHMVILLLWCINDIWVHVIFKFSQL